MKEPHEQRLDGDQVQAVIQQVHEYLRVEMRWNQAVQEEEANREQIPAPNIQKKSQMWLDAWHIQTTKPARKLNLKWLWLYTVICRISPSPDELKQPASIQTHREQPDSLWDLVVDEPLVE